MIFPTLSQIAPARSVVDNSNGRTNSRRWDDSPVLPGRVRPLNPAENRQSKQGRSIRNYPATYFIMARTLDAHAPPLELFTRQLH